jgi:hypothetical protein
MCATCNDALKNEHVWISVGLEAATLLERACQALPEGQPDREAGLACVAAIRTTPMYSAKRGPKTRVYPLPKPEELHAMPFLSEQ